MLFGTPGRNHDHRAVTCGGQDLGVSHGLEAHSLSLASTSEPEGSISGEPQPRRPLDTGLRNRTRGRALIGRYRALTGMFLPAAWGERSTVVGHQVRS